MKKLISFIFILLVSAANLQAADLSQIKPGSWLKNLSITTIWEGNSFAVPLQIYFPKNYKAGSSVKTLIALHDYEGSMTDWQNRSGIAAYADKYNIVVVTPQMGKTLYETAYYPESKIKWNPMPGGRWIADELVPFIQKEYKLGLKRNELGLIGVNSGGHGAVLLAALYPQVFGIACSVGGFFDTLAMTSNKRIEGVYGPYKDFSDRWKTSDYIMALAPNLENTPVFLIHGNSDYLVPFEQSRMFAIRLSQLQKSKGAGNPKKFTVKLIERKYKGAGWENWAGMLPDMFIFIDQQLGAN